MRVRPKLEAKPPPEASRLDQLRDPMQVSMEDDLLPAFLAEAESPAMARLRAQNAPKRPEDGTPTWIMALIGVGVALALIVLMAVLLGN